MKIKVAQIPDAGLELSESCESEDLDLTRADIRFTEPINLTCYVTKGIDSVSVNLKIEATMHFDCNRCLEEFTVPLSKEVALNFSIEDKEEINLTDNLREEIMFSYPLKPLCRADCRGLCTICGQNLNQGRCSHGAT